MDCWVDLDSGTFGVAESMVVVWLSDEDVEVFADLSDSERCDVARAMSENRDDPDFDFTSALAAVDL